jgi:hypothetical protein
MKALGDLFGAVAVHRHRATGPAPFFRWGWQGMVTMMTFTVVFGPPLTVFDRGRRSEFTRNYAVGG